MQQETKSNEPSLHIHVLPYCLVDPGRYPYVAPARQFSRILARQSTFDYLAESAFLLGSWAVHPGVVRFENLLQRFPEGHTASKANFRCWHNYSFFVIEVRAVQLPPLANFRFWFIARSARC